MAENRVPVAEVDGGRDDLSVLLQLGVLPYPNPHVNTNPTKLIIQDKFLNREVELLGVYQHFSSRMDLAGVYSFLRDMHHPNLAPPHFKFEEDGKDVNYFIGYELGGRAVSLEELATNKRDFFITQDNDLSPLYIQCLRGMFEGCLALQETASTRHIMPSLELKRIFVVKPGKMDISDRDVVKKSFQAMTKGKVKVGETSEARDPYYDAFDYNHDEETCGVHTVLSMFNREADSGEVRKKIWMELKKVIQTLNQLLRVPSDRLLDSLMKEFTKPRIDREVLSHPFFWDSSRKIRFICNLSESLLSNEARESFKSLMLDDDIPLQGMKWAEVADTIKDLRILKNLIKKHGEKLEKQRKALEKQEAEEKAKINQNTAGASSSIAQNPVENQYYPAKEDWVNALRFMRNCFSHLDSMKLKREDCKALTVKDSKKLLKLLLRTYPDMISRLAKIAGRFERRHLGCCRNCVFWPRHI